MVVALGSASDADISELRAIGAVEDESILRGLDLARALADRYLASFESCLRLVAPPKKTAGAAEQAAPQPVGVPDRAPGFVGVRTKAEVVAAGAVVAAGRSRCG